jgi:plastocyanin
MSYINNKIIIGIGIIAVVLLGGYFFFLKSASQPVTQPPASNETIQEQSPQEQPVSSEPVAGEHIVTYTDSGYLPSTLTIKKGETITFINKSSHPMWPASAYHPTHRVYSGTSLEEHCPDKQGIAFDACEGIPAGGFWSFTFDQRGTWKYHDHLNPSNTGTIVVVE